MQHQLFVIQDRWHFLLATNQAQKYYFFFIVSFLEAWRSSLFFPARPVPKRSWIPSGWKDLKRSPALSSRSSNRTEFIKVTVPAGMGVLQPLHSQQTFLLCPVGTSCCWIHDHFSSFLHCAKEPDAAFIVSW